MSNAPPPWPSKLAASSYSAPPAAPAPRSRQSWTIDSAAVTSATLALGPRYTSAVAALSRCVAATRLTECRLPSSCDAATSIVLMKWLRSPICSASRWAAPLSRVTIMRKMSLSAAVSAAGMAAATAVRLLTPM